MRKLLALSLLFVFALSCGSKSGSKRSKGELGKIDRARKGEYNIFWPSKI